MSQAHMSELIERATWFRFESSTGEWSGEYCSVKPHDATHFVPMVRLDEITRLQALVAQYEEGLERIRDYNWPELAGHHKQTFYGEATGNEYTLKHPIPRETASQALGSLKEIARTTLTAKGADHA